LKDEQAQSIDAQVMIRSLRTVVIARKQKFRVRCHERSIGGRISANKM
jgi:hypothetical protein